MSTGTIKTRYGKNITERDHYLRRARQAARYTIPSLMPEEGHSKSTALYTPYQGLGQRGMNNLSSKLLLILMPVDTPMFKLDVDDYQMREILGDAPAARGELDMAFNRIERAVTVDLAATGLRKSLGHTIKQLLVAGNVAVFQDTAGDARVWRLDQIVVRRSPSGELLELIVEEMISPSLLSAGQRIACECIGSEFEDDKDIEIYTRYWLDAEAGMYNLVQELNGHLVPGSDRTYPLDKSPVLVPTINRLPGENYGRGYIETVCLGDLVSFEGLSKYLLEGAAAAAKVLWMRNPNSTVRAKDLEKPNGSIINGNPNDVGALRLEKGNDFSFALQFANGIEARLEQVFLLNQSVQRTGERVTATEIQFVAQDIEDALGNLYTELGGDVQLPVVNYQLARLTRQKRIPKMPKGVVKPRITTGLAALGRGQDLRKIQGFTQDLSTFGGPEAHAQYLNISEFVKRLAAGHGIDTNGLIKTEEEIQAAVQAQQQAEMQQTLMSGPVGGQAAKALAPQLAAQLSGATGGAEPAQ